MARLLGLSDEQRIEIEQATGMKTEGVRLILEASLQQADQLAKQVLDKTIREVQEVVGPHGSVTRLQAGGVKISQGLGVAVYEDGVLKTTIEPDGDLLVGSDITQPSTTSFAVFVNEQTYNNELMGAGDLLFGDNTEAVSNVKFDASEGQLQFRYGQTVNVYMDTDGTLKAGGGEVIIDSNGVFINIPDSLNTVNAYKFGDTATGIVYSGLYAFRQLGTTTTAWQKTEDEIAQHYIQVAGDNGGGRIVLQAIDGDTASNNINELLFQWLTATGRGVVIFNNRGNDVDFTIQGDTDTSLFIADASLDAIGMGGAAESGYKAKIHGKVNITTGNTYDINGTPHTHTGLVTNGDSHDHNGGDGAAITDANLSTSDITTNNADTTKHGFAPKATAPASGLLSVLGIGNGETVRSDKALFDTTNPEDVGTAAPGTALVAARRDHVHGGSSNTIAAGTYTPALTNEDNVASSSLLQDFTYQRIDNVVTVVGAVSIDPTAAADTVTRMGISLPVASAFTTAYDASGNIFAAGTKSGGNVISDATNDRAQVSFLSQSTAAQTFRVMFQYIIK